MANEFMLAYQGELRGTPTYAGYEPHGSRRSFELHVLFTGLGNTIRALDAAAKLAHDLNASIRVIVPQLVPYPLPLESPPVLPEFTEQRSRAMAAAQQIHTRVEIFLCRNTEVLLRNILPASSTVVIGGTKRWWPTREERIARRLHRHGYEAIFVSDGTQEADPHA